MKRSGLLLGLLAALLLLAACAPAAPELTSGETESAAREDVSVLVYASPL